MKNLKLKSTILTILLFLLTVGTFFAPHIIDGYFYPWSEIEYVNAGLSLCITVFGLLLYHRLNVKKFQKAFVYLCCLCFMQLILLTFLLVNDIDFYSDLLELTRILQVISVVIIWFWLLHLFAQAKKPIVVTLVRVNQVCILILGITLIDHIRYNSPDLDLFAVYWSGYVVGFAIIIGILAQIIATLLPLFPSKK